MKKQLTIKNLLLVTTSMGLISCVGQSSDPMSKYADLKVSQPTSQQSETQFVAPDVFTDASPLEASEIVDLKLQGTNEVNNANFLENQEGVLYFKVLPKSTKISKFNVEMTDFSMGTQVISQRPMLYATDKANIFGLKWKAPVGLIPAGVSYVTLQATIKSSVVEASDANLKGLENLNKITFIISRNNSVPKILGRSSLAAGIDEGQSVGFTVDIEDSATSSSPKIPEMQVTPYIYSNTEAYRADGSKYVSMDDSVKENPKRFSDGSSKWRFYFKVNVDELPLDRDRKGIENPLSPAVDVCFHIRALSVINTQSEQQQVCFKARYAAQAPVIVWENEALKEVTSSVASVMKFKIASGNDLGQVELKDPQGQVSELSGSKELKCSSEVGGKLSSQVCELSWTPACVKTATTKKLTLKIDNKTGSKQKSQIFTKEFTVLPNEEACTKKPATKSTTTPKSKSATSTSTAKKTEGA